jgi:hypothetical protein
MSDTYFRYVPSDPAFTPRADAATQAEAVLRSMLPDAESIDAHFMGKVAFVDAGANWEGVSCSACGADAEPWWTEAMSEAAEGQFESLLVQAGCCGSQVSLNDLQYAWPVGFGRFMLEVANPGRAGLSSQELEQLGAALGCKVREVKAHL